MGWRGKDKMVQPAKHRGRIYRNGEGAWRYRCQDCDMGAGSTGMGLGVVPVYIDAATNHARQYGPPAHT